VSRVMQAASEPNFVGWLDKFYATWTERVASAVSECDGPPTLAADWTSESKRRLFEVASRVPDGLAEAVRAETALWQDRIDQLATAIVAGDVT